MRKPYRTVILSLTLLVFSALALWAAASTASFTPSPAGGSSVWTVINADRSAGATTTKMTVQWGSFQRTVGRGNPYGLCSGPMAGFVLRVENAQPKPVPLTVTTTGTIVRPPYQGVPPPEVSHNCYKLERIRARF
jgi:hypothetical protein